jgi:hypothetical protein
MQLIPKLVPYFEKIKVIVGSGYFHKNPDEGNKLTSAAHLLIKQKYSQNYTANLRESYYRDIVSSINTY